MPIAPAIHGPDVTTSSFCTDTGNEAAGRCGSGGDPAIRRGSPGGFVDHWLAGEELDLEAVGDVELGLLLGGGKGLGLAHEAGVGEAGEREGEENEKMCLHWEASL